jgi:hypothetical protein
MKRTAHALRAIVSLLLLLVSACGPSNRTNPATPLPTEVRSFAARKETQAKELAAKLHVPVAPDIWSYFDAAKKGNWDEVLRLWENLRKRAGQYEGSRPDSGVTTPVWQTVLETQLACEQYALGEPAYAQSFGQDIIKSIPPGSIYFGGTDAGRGLVTALCKSQETGDPFFALTQNALADGHYLTYLEKMYGGRIYTPTSEDSQKAFQDYLEDAQRRLQKKQLKPGEDVKIIDNRVQVSGQIAVMAINGLLSKVVFDRNPDRKFFIEESFPLDWMYPHLEPHGLIMAIEREPLPTLPNQILEADGKFWSAQLGLMIGDWLKPETPVKDVCAFAERVFLRKELAGFSGDPKFVANTNACAMYSKLRSAIGGLYAWRAAQSSEGAEKDQMTQAADFAFRQALAMCPYSPEAVFRYVNLLLGQNRAREALLVAQTTLKLCPGDRQMQDLVRRLEGISVR